jgi:TFIIF-interacting CTD phosphatase-like protein
MQTKQHKKNIILDLDQTIISAEATEEYNFEKNKDKAKKFKYHNMDSYYIVFERPGLQKFLNFLFSNFNVSVWTAASKDYALFIIEKIIIANKKNRKLDWVFFSYHCDISKRLKSGTKDLQVIWEDFDIPGYSKDNSVILDDYDEVFKTQKNNCIIAHPFEFTDKNSENDNFLEKLQPELLKFKRSKSPNIVNDINKSLE